MVKIRREKKENNRRITKYKIKAYCLLAKEKRRRKNQKNS